MSILTSQSAFATALHATFLVAGAAMAAGGGWVLSQALSRPAPSFAPLQPVVRQGTLAAPDADTRSERVWPLAFGQPRPVVETPPTPVAVEQEGFDDVEIAFNPDLYTLRGVVVTDTGGWAMIEAEGRVEIKRAGDLLLEGEVITRITEHGLELDVFGVDEFLELAERSQPAPASSRPEEGEDEFLDFTNEDDLGLTPDYGASMGPNPGSFGGGPDHDFSGDANFDDVMDLTTEDADFARQLGIGR